VAKLAGADIPVETSSRLIYTNLLKRPNENTWYLLVTNPSDADLTATGETVKVTLPTGDYQVTELIDGAGAVVAMSGDALREQGIALPLKEKNQTAIYKISNGK